MSSPYEGQITIDADLLHALWCYGTLQPVKGVIYSPHSHQECLAIVDRMFSDRAQPLSASAPSTRMPDASKVLLTGRMMANAMYNLSQRGEMTDDIRSQMRIMQQEWDKAAAEYRAAPTPSTATTDEAAPTASPEPHAVREALRRLIAVADIMPKETPAPGGAFTEHPFMIEAGKIWGLANEVNHARATLSRRDWHATEQAYNAIRDEFDRRPQRSAASSEVATTALAETINRAYLLTINAGGPTERHLSAEEFNTILAALRAATPTPSAARNTYAAGWQLVPVKPTREMTMHACGVLPAVDGVFGVAGQLCANVWKFMLEKAPDAPSSPDAVEALDQPFMMQEVLNFLNSIEGDGYGGMAAFEIVRGYAKALSHPRNDRLPTEVK